MTRTEASVLYAAITAVLADPVYAGYVAWIGREDEGITSPLLATGWYVRVDRLDIPSPSGE